jgi:GPI mannosyltransferase 3
LKLLGLSALACMFRPTNAILWIFLYGKLFWSRQSDRRNPSFLGTTASVATVALVSLCALDTIYHGRDANNFVVFTPFNFLKTNLTSVSLFYGSNPWHYYLIQALPILCTTALPFVLHGSWAIWKDPHSVALRVMLASVIWYISVFSLMGHKEWRFIHPVLPLLHLFAAKSLVNIAESYPIKGARKRSRNKKKPGSRTFLLPIRRTHLFLLLSTLPASIYVVLFYCDAPISVLGFIRSLPRAELHKGIGFLMPCHSTPGQAYIHREELANGSMWALGCEPPLGVGNPAAYEDQTNVFFKSPISYLEAYFPSKVDPAFPHSPFPASIPGTALQKQDASGLYPWRHSWPQYLIFFGQLLKHEGVKDLLEHKGYREIWKRGREWEGEGERKGGVRVWKWEPRR